MIKPKLLLSKQNAYIVATLLILLSTTPFFMTTTAQPYQQTQNNLFTYDYQSANEIILTVHTPNLKLSEFTNEYGTFTTVSIPNFGYIAELGKPLLPQITTNIAITTSDISIEVIDTQIRDIFETTPLYPAQEPQSDTPSQIPQEFFYNTEFYQKTTEYPIHLANKLGEGSMREIPFIKLGIYPVHCNPANNKITVYDSITIKITSTASNNKLEVEHQFPHHEFKSLYMNSFSNWEPFTEHTTFIEKEPQPLFSDGADLIIITHPTFYSKAKELAEWRHKTGLMTVLLNVTDIGSTSTDIQTYIQNAYDTWNPQPAYVLLIGDAEYVPTSASSTDLYYVTTDGTDYFPDMYIGRIPADTLAQAEIMIDKILDYDQNPPADYDFYENLALAAYFQDDENNGYETRRFVRTSEEIRDNLSSYGYTGERIYVTPASRNPTNYNNGYYGNGEPLPPELLRVNGFPWDGDSADITNAVNQGVFILNHRDHGSPSGWGDPHYDTTNIAQLTNGDLLPVVFSMNCQTGQFHNTESFCEEFVRKADGGAIASYGASRTSYSGYNDYMCLGFYDAIWPQFNPNIGDSESLNRFGQILNNGKVYMSLTWGDPWGYEEIEFEMFHVFCDPSQRIRTAYPMTLTVDSPPTIPYGPSMVEITVTNGGQPVENALVCLRQTDNVYVSGYTDNTGLVELEVDIQEPDEAMLTVTAYNYLAYETTVQIGTSLPPLPPTVDGIPVGKPNKEYIYTAETTDPEGDQILFKFDWGDGTQSDWLGPVNSGESISESHAWPDVGNYTLKVRAKDINDSTSYWSEPYNIHMTLPMIDLSTIEGGLLRASVNVRNYGLAEADDIKWSINLDGGFILLGKETTGIVPTIEAGGVATIKTGLIFGFGSTRVIASVEIDEGTDYRSQGANVILFFIQVKPGGG